MPFQSKAQMRYLYANRPDIAQRWSAHYTQDVKSLPEKKKKIKIVKRKKK